MQPLLDEEVDKLINLQDKHKKYYQMTLFDHERKLEEKERNVDLLVGFCSQHLRQIWQMI